MDQFIVDAVVADLVARPECLREYVKAVETLLANRDAVLDLIPPCRIHGTRCVAHAKEWVCEQRARILGLWDEDGRQSEPMPSNGPEGSRKVFL